jgi:phosphoribosylformylglycinamidine synthase
VPDITAHVTPDIKRPGESVLIHIDIADGKTRLGGSALAHVYEQLGNESPDVDNANTLKRGFVAMQKLVSEGMILSAHDVSDGGLIVTVLEMAFSGNCGMRVHLGAQNPFGRLFAEELGWVVECGEDDVGGVLGICATASLSASVIGHTLEDEQVHIICDSKVVLDADMPTLRERWEETSYQLERLQMQMNPVCADQEKGNNFRRKGPEYYISFEPSYPPPSLFTTAGRIKVAILREEGSNGYREMTVAFYQAGFMPWDITMTDLLEGRVTLDDFRGLVAVGGFSYADVPASAKGWAATIRFNPKLEAMFERFYSRSDTFSLGVCNGCQLFGLLGIVPWPWAGVCDEDQPRFVHNVSGRFESRWSTVKILSSHSIMLQGMEGSTLGVWTAHGEGRLEFPNPQLLEQVRLDGLAPVRYADDDGVITQSYPFNPNGSPQGIAGLCSPDGRHLAMMPHPERAFLDWQWPWMPDNLKSESGFSPWLQMFINARVWCENNG